MPILLLLALGAAALALAGQKPAVQAQPPAAPSPGAPPPLPSAPPPVPGGVGKPISEPLTPLEAQGMGGVSTMGSGRRMATSIGEQFGAGMSAYWSSPKGKAEIAAREATKAWMVQNESWLNQCVAGLPASVADLVKTKLAASAAEAFASTGGTGLPPQALKDLGLWLKALDPSYITAGNCLLDTAEKMAIADAQKAHQQALVDMFKAAGF